MMNHRSHIDINRPVSDVFTYVSNLENIPRWQSEVVTSRVTSPGSMRVGLTFEENVKLFGRTFQNVCEVTEYLPTRRFAFKSTSGTPFRYTGSFSFEANGRGTKLTLSVESALMGFWKIFEPIARMEMKNGIEGELKTLKSILETNS